MKWVVFWVVVGCVWLVLAPAIAAVIVVASMLWALFTHKPPPQREPRTRIRIIIRDHEETPPPSA